MASISRLRAMKASRALLLSVRFVVIVISIVSTSSIRVDAAPTGKVSVCNIIAF